MDFNKTMPLRPPKPAATKENEKEPAKDQLPIEPTLPVGKEPPAIAKPPQPAAKQQPKPAVTKEQPAPIAKPADNFQPETAADAWLGLLASRGVEYLFANGGTD